MRQEWTERRTTVRYVAKPSGRNQDNPPNLGHLRDFVNHCEGLPSDTHVFISTGHLGEGGRHDMTFSLEIIEKLEDE